MTEQEIRRTIRDLREELHHLYRDAKENGDLIDEAAEEIAKLQQMLPEITK